MLVGVILIVPVPVVVMLGPPPAGMDIVKPLEPPPESSVMLEAPLAFIAGLPAINCSDGVDTSTAPPPAMVILTPLATVIEPCFAHKFTDSPVPGLMVSPFENASALLPPAESVMELVPLPVVQMIPEPPAKVSPVEL